MAKIFLHIQTLSMIDRASFASNFELAFMLGRHTKHEIHFLAPPRASIDRGRNEAAREALRRDCEYLWFLDDDMVIDWRTLDSLIAVNRDIVMEHSFIRGYPYKPMCFRWKNGKQDEEIPELEYFETDEELESLKDENGICDVASVGFTCTVIKCDILKKLNPPYFITNPHSNGTEDVYFCMRCKMEIGADVSIAVDMKYPTVHLGDKVPIHKNTVKMLRKLEEEMNPLLLQMKDGRIDRSKEYHESVIKA